jgi:hypothetical protein
MQSFDQQPCDFRCLGPEDLLFQARHILCCCNVPLPYPCPIRTSSVPRPKEKVLVCSSRFYITRSAQMVRPILWETAGDLHRQPRSRGRLGTIGWPRILHYKRTECGFGVQGELPPVAQRCRGAPAR